MKPFREITLNTQSGLGLSGILFCLGSNFLYATKGFQLNLFCLWLLGLACITLSLYRSTDHEAFSSVTKSEILISLAICLVFAPLYLMHLNGIPVQVNTDEIVIGLHVRRFTTPHLPDLFATSDYFDFPAFIFILFGWIAKGIGGMTFPHLRWVHALFGLLITFPAYFFFRLLLSRFHAGLVTIAILSNHSLLAISRMVSRNNVALLNELAAFVFLLLGLQRQSRFYSFIGGAIAGLSFYQYPPARLIFFIWAGSVICTALFSRLRKEPAPSMSLLLISFMGFLAVISPMLIASAKSLHNNNSYGRQQVLLFAEGRQHQAHWYGVSEGQGILRNIRQGLLMFNEPINDQAYIYFNPGHGFIDPSTGILLWIGLILVLVKIRSKQQTQADLLFLFGFALLWAVYLFVFGETPNYTRLFLIIPFIVYFSFQALHRFAHLAAQYLSTLPRVRASYMEHGLLAIFILCIATSNLQIFGDFVLTGQIQGDPLGGTGRYIETLSATKEHAFYLATDQRHPYYSWSDTSAWREWTAFFATQDQSVQVINPDILWIPIAMRPFTIFMSDQVWLEHHDALMSLYPRFNIVSLTPAGGRIAFEVLKDAHPPS